MTISVEDCAAFVRHLIYEVNPRLAARGLELFTEADVVQQFNRIRLLADAGRLQS